MKYKIFVDDNGELKEVLDTGEFDALRQLVAQEVAKAMVAANVAQSSADAAQRSADSKLPLIGGMMTGEIQRNGTLVRTTSPQSDLYLLAGEGYERIAGLFLRGYNANNYPGYAQLMAGDSVKTALLNLAPTGRLTVNGNAVATVPNWPGIIAKSVNTDYTAEVDGYILFASSDYGYPNSDMKSFIKINDVQYQVSAEIGAAAVFQALCLPLAKGDKYTFYPGRTGNGEYLYFIPLKGAV